MKLRGVLLIGLILSAGVDSLAQSDIVQEVMAIIAEHSLMKDSVDLEAIRNLAINDTRQGRSPQETIREILHRLNDHHSFLMTREEVEKWKTTSKSPNIPTPFTGRIINGDLGYIRMSGYASGDPASNKSYGNTLQAMIRDLESPGIMGWIVDLRENTGGNCWPMLAGIGPILGDGTCGYFVGLEKSNFYYKEGKSGSGTTAIVETDGPTYHVRNKRVAVLTGERTASSGEVIVVAFRGRQNTRSFGMPTAGLSTANKNFMLSDGSMLLLTTSVYADRNGNKFGRKIAPDEHVDFSYDEIGEGNDPVIDRAVAWLHSREPKK